MSPENAPLKPTKPAYESSMDEYDDQLDASYGGSDSLINGGIFDPEPLPPADELELDKPISYIDSDII